MRKAIKKIKTQRFFKRYRRKLSIRAKISGTSDRPRACVNKTNKNISVQVINDVDNVTLFTVSTYGQHSLVKGNSKASAIVIGEEVAKKLREHHIEKIVYDRNGLPYTGKIALLANKIRECGISL